MFQSFFPNPRLFFPSTVIWGVVMVAGWYLFAGKMMTALGIPIGDPNNPVIGLQYFWTPDFIFWYAYFTVGILIFYLFWRVYSPHPWINWSILGSAFIIFTTYYSVQVNVVINNWYNPFYDLIQKALATPGAVTLVDFYGYILIFLEVALVFIAVLVLTRFFVQHYTFRWRVAMNDFYVSNWPDLRHIEGASQRVQEDTMNFATTLEPLGVSFLNSVMTLIAFLPQLVRLSANITELPIVGKVAVPLVLAALFWSALGTSALAIIGIRLPGLNFRNQRVEAAYRKELVYGEDNPARAQPPTLRELFEDVRKNYFRLFFAYSYFYLGFYVYFQIDNIYGYVILGPTIVAGAITLGVMQQISGCLRPGARVISVPGQRLDDDRFAAFNLQAPARV